MRLFDLFSLHQDLPIRIDDIADVILEKGYVEAILFHETDESGHAISGMLYHEHLKGPYASNTGYSEVAHIIYQASLSPREKRLVCAKELLHICDSSTATAKQPKTVDQLIRELTIPPAALAEVASIRPETIADKTGMIRAVAILFPKECRDMLKPHVDSGKLSEEQIVSLVDIPVEYVRLVMSDLWDDLFDKIKEIEGQLSC